MMTPEVMPISESTDTKTLEKVRDNSGFGRWLQWGLVGVIFIFCALFLDFGEIFETLSGISFWWLVGILILMTLDRVLMAWKWLGLLKALVIKISFKDVVRFYYQGNLTGVFLPTGLGGDLFRAHLVSRQCGAAPPVYASLLMEKMIGFLSAFWWGILGTYVLALVYFKEEGSLWLGWILAGFLYVLGIFVWSLQPTTIARFQPWLTRGPKGRIKEFLQQIFEAYSRFRQSRSALLKNAVLTLLEQGLQLSVYLAMATSLGFRVPIMGFLAVTTLFLLIYRLPISPDGWGVGEVVAIGLYGLIGMSAEQAFTMVLLGHILQTVVVLPGLVFMMRSPLTK